MKPMVRFLVAAAPVAVLVALSGGLAAQSQKPDPLLAREREDLTRSQFSKPPELAPKEYRDMMRANNEILGIDTPPENPTGGAVFRGAFQGALAQHFTLHQEDYDAIVKDARTLKANFAKIEAFFAERKSGDGVELARAGQKALEEMEAGAAAKNRVAALRAAIGVATTCRNCHLSHRVYVVTEPITFGIVG
jgi:hypothetical protein